MPESNIYYYKKEDGGVPFFDWIKILAKREKKAAEKCFFKLKLLKALRSELRRSHADFLRNGIYELRVAYKHQQYRILYFFYGKDIIVISHGITKEKKVPVDEIDKAIARKVKFETNPSSHILQEDEHV